MEKFNFEQENNNEALESLMGDNFNPEKTIALEKDVDEKNQEQPLGDYEAHWTEMINPDTGETVEGKVYTPEGDSAKDVLIVCPGYKGDFVLQEKGYADDMCRDGRAIVFLRHNNLRTKGGDVENYVHCPQKQETNSEYTGKGEGFDVREANREVLTALKSLGSNIDNLDKIDIIGHSWGGMIALESLMDIAKEEGENSKKIIEKINNLILLAATLESRPENYEAYQSYFQADADKGYFKDMDAEEMVEGFKENAKDFNEDNLKNLPKNIKVTSLNSMIDGDINKEEETVPFHFKLDSSTNPRLIFFQDGNYGPNEWNDKSLGGRGPEEHDYAGSEARKWLKKIIG